MTPRISNARVIDPFLVPQTTKRFFDGDARLILCDDGVVDWGLVFQLIDTIFAQTRVKFT